MKRNYVTVNLCVADLGYNGPSLQQADTKRTDHVDELDHCHAELDVDSSGQVADRSYEWIVRLSCEQVFDQSHLVPTSCPTVVPTSRPTVGFLFWSHLVRTAQT